MKKCNKCKIDYSNDLNFCKKCGNSLEYFESKEEKKQKEIKAEKNKKALGIIGYIFGIIIILGSLSDFFSFKFYGITGVLFGMSILPVVHKKIFEIEKIKKIKFINKHKKNIKIFVPVFLGFVWALSLPAEQLTAITINDGGHIIAINETYEIDFTTNLSETDKSKFEYVSSDNSIATVEDGFINGKKEGKVSVTIKGDNEIESTAEYEIKYVEIEKMEITGNVKLQVGKKSQLKILTTPSVVSDKISKWESSDASIISVDNKGNITANKKGKAVISAYSDKGKKAEIEVGAYVEIKSMSISETNAKVEKGKSITLSVNLEPTDADKDGIVWSSGDNNIATVDNGVVKGIKEGKTTITAVSVNGIKAVSNIEVYEVKPESVSLNSTTVALNVGQTTTVYANVSPENASDKSISWTSSNNGVASVQNGVITANAIGTAKITAKTVNGKKATVDVTVKKNAPIKINNFRYTIDSVCGVEWNFSITNTSGKTINYITLKWYNLNGVGDFVYDQITLQNYVQLRYTGPLYPGQNSGGKRNTSKFYNCSYKSSSISDVKIEYEDGTVENITSSDMKYYNNLY